MKEYHLEQWKKMQFIIVEDRCYDSSIEEGINTTYERAHIKSVSKISDVEIGVEMHDAKAIQFNIPVDNADEFLELWEIFILQIGHVMLLVEPTITRLKTSDVVDEKGKDKPVWAFVAV